MYMFVRSGSEEASIARHRGNLRTVLVAMIEVILMMVIAMRMILVVMIDDYNDDDK